MKLSSRDQLILAGVVIALAAVAFVILLIVPRFADLAQARDDAAKADQDIAAAQQTLSRRQEAKTAAADTQAQLTRLENEVPDAPEMAALIIDLQDTANDAGVDFDKLVLTKPVAASEGFDRIHLAFEIVGQWDDILDYMRRLAELQRAVRILQVDFAPRTVASGATVAVEATRSVTFTVPQNIRGVINIEVYMLSRSATPGGQAAPSAPQ